MKKKQTKPAKKRAPRDPKDNDTVCLWLSSIDSAGKRTTHPTPIKTTKADLMILGSTLSR